MVFRVSARDIKYIYVLELSPTEAGYSLGYRSPAVEAELPSLRVGVHLVFLDSRDCNVSLYQITMDPDFCHGKSTD